MAPLKVTEKLCSDLSVIMMCLAKLHISRRPWTNEHSFVSMPHLYVMFEDGENQLEYIFFKILVHVICFVARDINLP